MQTDKMATTAVSLKSYENKNDANEECGSEGPGSGSQLEVKELAKRSSHLRMVNIDNPVLVGDMSRHSAVQHKKEIPTDDGKGEKYGTVYSVM